MKSAINGPSDQRPASLQLIGFIYSYYLRYTFDEGSILEAAGYRPASVVILASFRAKAITMARGLVRS